MRLLILAGLAVGLTGCQTTPLEELAYAERIELAKVIVATCEKQGITSPSQQFDDCTNAEIQRERATRANNRQRQIAMGEALAAGAGSMSSAYYGAAASTPSYSAPRQVTCTTVNAPAGHSAVRCY